MKRCAALRSLSSEHHHGLVLAGRARAAAGSEVAESQWQDIRERFASELEPHFRAEEQVLLPALQRAGEGELVRRTLREHGELRNLVAERGTQAMAEFAELLVRHIRFEERELFEAAQQKLPAAELDALADHMGNRTPGASAEPY